MENIRKSARNQGVFSQIALIFTNCQIGFSDFLAMPSVKLGIYWKMFPESPRSILQRLPFFDFEDFAGLSLHQPLQLTIQCGYYLLVIGRFFELMVYFGLVDGILSGS